MTSAITFANRNFYSVSSKFDYKPVLRFGRDALFERHANDIASGHVLTQDTFEGQQKLDSSSKNAKKTVPYESSGRFIEGRTALPQAIKEAVTDYMHFLRDGSSHSGENSEIEMSKAGVKLANARLAKDSSPKVNQDAFMLLSQSLKTLGFLDKQYRKNALSPVTIHGLYNLGTYAFNNDLYEANIRRYGMAHVRDRDKSFEGLLTGYRGDAERLSLFTRIEAGLPHLNEAIKLAETIPDHHLSKAEYLIARGEIQHALSHLVIPSSGYGSTKEITQSDKYSREARLSFKSAQTLLTDIKETSHFSPRHKRLLEKLEGIKISHVEDKANYHTILPLGEETAT